LATPDMLYVRPCMYKVQGKSAGLII
jgi:hypothetical protein